MICEFDKYCRHYRDSAAMAAQSWPGANPHFRRRWNESLDEAPQPGRAPKLRVRSSTDPTVLNGALPFRATGPWSSRALQAEAQS
jgi:hypothetical protein